MTLFSQRRGMKPVSKVIQIEAMDDELRNSLWTALQVCIWNKWSQRQPGAGWSGNAMAVNNMLQDYWIGYFKRPVDTKPPFQDAVKEVRKFFFSCPWNEVYDFIEFTAKTVSPKFRDEFCAACNGFLQKENSAYRFVGLEIAQITSPEEIESIESAISSGIKGIHIHLSEALSKLSDRKSPDYRNSIKESISAVEAVCRLVSGDEKATLGDALKRIGATQAIHPALEKAFAALYGYTNDADGIRHSLLEEDKLLFTDAKFMLVACSGFINYVLGKCADLGIPLNPK